MKIIQNKSTFKPIEVTFVFETQKEIDAMSAIFSHTDVNNALRAASENHQMPSQIHAALQAAGASYDNVWGFVSHLTSSK